MVFGYQPPPTTTVWTASAVVLHTISLFFNELCCFFYRCPSDRWRRWGNGFHTISWMFLVLSCFWLRFRIPAATVGVAATMVSTRFLGFSLYLLAFGFAPEYQRPPLASLLPWFPNDFFDFPCIFTNILHFFEMLNSANAHFTSVG